MLLRIELVILAVWTTSAMASITFSCFSYPLFDFPSLGFSSTSGLYQINISKITVWSGLFSSNLSFGKYFLDEARKDWWRGWSWRRYYQKYFLFQDYLSTQTPIFYPMSGPTIKHSLLISVSLPLQGNKWHCLNSSVNQSVRSSSGGSDN